MYEALPPGGAVPTLPSLLVVSVTEEVTGIVTEPLVENVGKKDTLPLEEPPWPYTEVVPSDTMAV